MVYLYQYFLNGETKILIAKWIIQIWGFPEGTVHSYQTIPDLCLLKSYFEQGERGKAGNSCLVASLILTCFLLPFFYRQIKILLLMLLIFKISKGLLARKIFLTFYTEFIFSNFNILDIRIHMKR